MFVNIFNKNPIFSIIIPTYNRLKMLKRAIKSVCKQTFKDFEIIVVDDNSIKPCSPMLSKFKGVRLHVIKNASNLGAAESRNIGIQAAKGKYISFLDDDDEYLSSFLAATYKHLKNTPETIGLSWCGVKYANYSKNSILASYVKATNSLPKRPSKQQLFEELFSSGTGFGVTFKVECIRKIGAFNSKLKVTEDTDIFLRFFIAGFLPIMIPETHIIVHNHQETKLTSVTTHKTRIKECRWILNQYVDFFNEYPKLRSNLIDHMKCLAKELAN